MKELLIWYLGFAIAHDLVFVPAYTGLDRLFRATIARLPLRDRTGLPVINYVRAPAVISALLLIIYFPLISRRNEAWYFDLSGHYLDALPPQLVADHGGAVPRVRAHLCGASCPRAGSPGSLTSVHLRRPAS